MKKIFFESAIPILLLLLAVQPLHAEEYALPTPSACFRQAADRYTIPVELLIAVAEAESGLTPFAMNRAGAAILPRSREEAEAVLKRIGSERPTFDVGIMQVNRWWFERYGVPYEKGLDVCFNVDFGARILAMAIKDHGFTWKAVGAYHSPTGWRQSAYAMRIYTRLARILENRRVVPLQELLESKLERVSAVYDPGR
ncbi:MAG: lytic transglycosylase domain-containing protein [Pelobacteraceae bacterium]